MQLESRDMNRDVAPAASRKTRTHRSIGVWAIIAVLSSAAVGVAAFALLGPPRGWGTSVENAAPRFATESSPAVRDGLAAMAADTVPAYSYAALLASYDVPGRPRDFDERAESGEAVLVTSGETWTVDQRLFWRRRANERWSEVGVPRGFVINNPRLFSSAGKSALLLER